MEVWVNLQFDDGDFDQGFSKVKIKLDTYYTNNYSTQLEIQLPPAQEIPNDYECWKKTYESFLQSNSRGFKKNQVTNFSADTCFEYAKSLRAKLNQWLLPIKSQLEPVITSGKNVDIRLVVNTHEVTSEATRNILHRIPWQECHLFGEHSSSEVALCFKDSLVSEVGGAIQPNSETFRRIKIINIFGDSRNLDTSTDEKLILDLEKRGAETIFLKEPKREELHKLWDEPCDILFFAGHSESRDYGQKGIISINPNESLDLEEIPKTLKSAIRGGLKLAIFNSCDGLGLAQRLVDLNLPYVIVWREPVPDRIAHKFLNFFLHSYAGGDSLFTAVSKARGKLQELTEKSESEKPLPGVSWLPIICKNTLELPPGWEDLGGLSGKLPECPYQGLSAFGEEEADFFFGREKFVDELVAAVQSKSLVSVVGASGSGKSSVVFAELVPRLRKLEDVQIISFRPGNNPLGNLAIALNHHCHFPTPLQGENSTDTQRRLDEMLLDVDLRNDETKLAQFINDHTTSCRITTSPNSLPANEEGDGKPKHLVLIADQFEELYTLAPQEERQPFLDALIYAINYAPRFTLVLTLRADFYGYALSYRPFSDALQKGIYNLGPMNREELRCAVEKPAQKMKVVLEEGLTDVLIKDLGNEPGRLPLLEFTLTQLWLKPRKWFLTHEAYQEIGGLEKALANYADTVLDNLSQDDRKRAEQIFIQLVRPGEGTEDTRRVATRQEIGEKNWDLVRQLADKRLLVTGCDETSKNKKETVEIIHEALIREWRTFRQWIQDNREFRIWQERFKQDVRDWENSNQNSEALLQGTRLAIAESWYKQRKDELKPQGRDFITASITRREQEQQKQKLRRQLTIFGLTGSSLIALMLAGVAWLQWQNAHFNEIKNITVSSQALLSSGQNLKALLKSLEASIKLKETPSFLVLHRLQEKADIQKQVDISLQNALYKVTERNRLEKHKDEVTDVSFSPEGNIIATASKDKTAKLWSLDGKEITTLQGHEALVSKVRFSPTGKIIATASWDGTVKLWTREGKLVTTLKENNKKLDSVYGLDFSPDGQTIFTADSGGNVKIWTIKGELIKSFKAHNQTILNLSFAPSAPLDAPAVNANSSNGNIFATTSQDNTVKLWSRDGKLLRTLTGHKDWVWSVSFSPNDRKIATASRDKTVKFWSIDGNLIRTLDAHKNSVTSVSFSPDGKQITSAGVGSNVKFWSESGEELQTLRGHKNWVWSVSFATNGNMLATASKDGTAKLWQLKGKKYQIYQAHNSKIYGVNFSPNGKEYVTASQDKTVKIWQRSGELIKTLKWDNNEFLKNPDAGFTDVSFSP